MLARAEQDYQSGATVSTHSMVGKPTEKWTRKSFRHGFDSRRVHQEGPIEFEGRL